jgi:putative ABC transport system permease protein
MQNKKQALTISVIVAAVTMASVIATAVDYSLNVNGYNFARAAFGEIPDVNFTLKDASEGEGFKERLLKYPEVRKVFGYEAGTLYMQVDGTNVVFCVAEDCSLLEGAMLIDGRYPKHNNEIAVGPVASRVTGKGINDRVIIINGEHEREYIITGLVQYINNDGLNGLITGEGLSGVAPGYEFAAFNVYLNDGADAKDFIQSVKAAQGDLIDVVLDTNGQVYSMLDTVAAVFSAVAAGTVIITALVVVATLFLVIKTLITQRRRELGIQKAVGFTTFRLMNQIALNLTPIILIGVTAGGGLGYFGFNPFFTAIARAFGLAKLSMPVPLDRAAAICAGLVILAYAVSLLIAWRIRKISAYALVSE